ncbi:hypothetical protein E2562_002665 [Oryza meyeriana var. granulata]|uniref:Uncharacterized protein n=1 Tax=Oryza meyeriana var. granulata TaxID=110450 RepID=A0A6G1BQD0_9ORYZ|nr:hypothetical protein E2562_002665 [Oryza meyeriana var. granulata]
MPFYVEGGDCMTTLGKRRRGERWTTRGWSSLLAVAVGSQPCKEPSCRHCCHGHIDLLPAVVGCKKNPVIKWGANLERVGAFALLAIKKLLAFHPKRRLMNAGAGPRASPTSVDHWLTASTQSPLDRCEDFTDNCTNTSL